MAEGTHIADEAAGLRATLALLRGELLPLHKLLLDSERGVYGQTHVPIRTNGEFLQLLLSDDWFSWLRLLSTLIVQIDETLDAKEPEAAAAEMLALIRETERLLMPSESGTGFSKRYYDALQREPEVILAHGRIRGMLGNRG